VLAYPDAAYAGGLTGSRALLDLAQRGARVAGRVPLSSCARLAELIEPEPAGDPRDPHPVATRQRRIAIVRGQVDAELAMPCQRCLDRVPIRVQSELKLAIVADETQLVPDEFEPFIATEGLGRLADLVEEEILLSLPEYPVHESVQQCGELVARVLELEQTPREHPFDVLRRLKTDQS
jgi:uncharacterized protein